MEAHINIDKAGRVVIPKDFRDALGISESSILEGECINDQIIIRPKREEAKLVRQGKWWILKHNGPKTTESTDYIKEMRDERTKNLLRHFDSDSES